MLYVEYILTDNGPEFRWTDYLEWAPYTGERRCRVFYCDPMASWQKAEIEKNHEFIRYSKGLTRPFIITFKFFDSRHGCELIRNFEFDFSATAFANHFCMRAGIGLHNLLPTVTTT